MKKQLPRKAKKVAEMSLETSWQQLESQFRAARWVEPSDGFARRWQARWSQAERRQLRLRNNWQAAANGFAILLLLIVLPLGLWAALSQPGTLGSGLIGGVVAFATFIVAIFRISVSVLFALPMSIWFFFCATCIALLGLWAAVFRRALSQEE